MLWAPTPATLATRLHPRLTIGGSFDIYPRRNPFDLDHALCHRDESYDPAPTPRTRWHTIPDGPLTPAARRAVLTAADAATADWYDGAHVLVRCYLGLNRSGLVAGIIYARVTGRSGAEALAHIRAKRSPHALCNPAFARYLATYTP